ncbi:N-hydroxyarylamine O-acetyltransferase [Nocardioides sp. BE266]|uniref:arylamine N-acetyltransferase family protein n=1 Tax=Nocardioides sp. BE266 TaxID=2817725 RepID=UPI0028659C17|nr:arylamine N-acetyltransferase [Nocardioides sp. BE266]MDR7251652.1 N-hydroxyarylamine O-acetyltransferase [Nocardioides sp. BE266]
MTGDPWQVDRLDLDSYLARVGVPASPPSRASLDALHEAHVRSFTFDNVDVLLDRHAGVSLEAVQEKFVGRGRGGYCFEHSTLFAAVLERLGYDVRRHLGRVGDPAAGTQQARTHMTISAVVDGSRVLCDPGFGMSLLRPVPLEDGGEDDYLPGWRYRVRRTTEGWALERLREAGWEVAHTTDDLAVLPVDVAMGHHFTSTFPGSHFRSGLMVTRHLPGRHVTVTHEALTVRVAGGPTEHRPLRDGELGEWLDALETGLSDEERELLLSRFASPAAP